MGWASGSELADILWSEVRNEVSNAGRQHLARVFVKTLSYFDCDTLDECKNLIDDAGRDWCRAYLGLDLE